MRCLVTCGPTYEPLDKVRRLTNFSTGTLGIALANHLVDSGHSVTLLSGYYATCRDICRAQTRHEFTTTESLLDILKSAAASRWEAVFHAAAVSDFSFGKVYRRGTDGKLEPLTSGKHSTRDGPLLAELIPTVKVLPQLAGLFPTAKIVGWKYEVDGDRATVLSLAQRQLAEARTHFAVANGPAYGEGFGLAGPQGLVRHCPKPQDLFNAFDQFVLGPA